MLPPQAWTQGPGMLPPQGLDAGAGDAAAAGWTRGLEMLPPQAWTLGPECRRRLDVELEMLPPQAWTMGLECCRRRLGRWSRGCGLGGGAECLGPPPCRDEEVQPTGGASVEEL